MTKEDDTACLKETFYHEQKRLKQQNPEIAAASKSVIEVVAYKKGVPLGRGSGAVIAGDHILTAAHVVQGADDLVYYTTAASLNLATNFDGGDIVVNDIFDIALLPLPEVFQGIVPPLSFAARKNTGGNAFMIGFPAVNDQVQLPAIYREPTIHPVTAATDKQNPTRLIMNVPDETFTIGRGASGGPIVNKDGQIVGIDISGIEPFSLGPFQRTHILYARKVEVILFIFKQELKQSS